MERPVLFKDWATPELKLEFRGPRGPHGLFVCTRMTGRARTPRGLFIPEEA